MYRLVIRKLIATRALWLDAVRILPLVSMGEKDTALLLSQEDILQNIIMNDNLNLDLPPEQRLAYLNKIEEKQTLKVNRTTKEMGGYNGLMAI